jgi:hypothetical protein
MNFVGEGEVQDNRIHLFHSNSFIQHLFPSEKCSLPDMRKKIFLLQVTILLAWLKLFILLSSYFIKEILIVHPNGRTSCRNEKSFFKRKARQASSNPFWKQAEPKS